METSESQQKKPDLMAKLGDFFKPVGSVVAIAIAIFSGYTGYQKFIEESPSLLIELEDFDLKGYASREQLLGWLTDTEQKHGDVTAAKIISLKETLNSLELTNDFQVQDFLKLVYSEINNFQRLVPAWTEGDIVYYDGKIMWPDQTQFNIKSDSNAANIFPNHYKAIQGGSQPDANTVAEIKKIAFALYKPFGEEAQAKRMQVAQDLRAVRVAIENALNNRNHFMEVKIKIINRSRQPNLIKQKSEVQLTDAKSSLNNILLNVKLESESVIPGIGYTTITLHSDNFDRLSQAHITKLKALKKNEANLQLTLYDVYGEKWVVSGLYDGAIGSIRSKEESTGLVASVFNVFNK